MHGYRRVPTSVASPTVFLDASRRGTIDPQTHHPLTSYDSSRMGLDTECWDDRNCSRSAAVLGFFGLGCTPLGWVAIPLGITAQARAAERRPVEASRLSASGLIGTLIFAAAMSVAVEKGSSWDDEPSVQHNLSELTRLPRSTLAAPAARGFLATRRPQALRCARHSRRVNPRA